MVSDKAFYELIGNYQNADTFDKTIGYIAFAKFEQRRREVLERIGDSPAPYVVETAIQSIELSIPDFLLQAETEIFAALDEYALQSLEKEKDRLYNEVFLQATEEIKSKLTTNWTREIIKGVVVTVATVVITGAIFLFLDMGRARSANDAIDQLQELTKDQSANQHNVPNQKALPKP